MERNKKSDFDAFERRLKEILLQESRLKTLRLYQALCVVVIVVPIYLVYLDYEDDPSKSIGNLLMNNKICVISAFAMYVLILALTMQVHHLKLDNVIMGRKIRNCLFLYGMTCDDRGNISYMDFSKDVCPICHVYGRETTHQAQDRDSNLEDRDSEQKDMDKETEENTQPEGKIEERKSKNTKKKTH